MKGLSKRQQEVVNFIQTFIDQHSYSPSYREIQKHFNYTSLGTVYSLIKVLERKQAIQLQKGSSRSLALNLPQAESKSASETSIPFVGYIAAGFPIETFPQTQMISLPHTMVPYPDHTYVLRAIGDTLNEELIADGDLLIVEARQEANTGEMIVGLINQHDTVVKRYFPEGKNVRLEGRNTHFQALVLDQEALSIQGVLIGVLRQYEAS